MDTRPSLYLEEAGAGFSFMASTSSLHPSGSEASTTSSFPAVSELSDSFNFLVAAVDEESSGGASSSFFLLNFSLDILD